MGKANEEDASDRWMTGIVEVELPVAHRLDNIEATELAKASMLNTKMFKRWAPSRLVACVYAL